MVEEDSLKHLEFIQNIVTRMANNSFLLKGWTVTIVSALFALAAQNSNSKFVILAFLPVLTFWALDAYYLWQERLYRKLYDDVRKGKYSTVESFSLDATPHRKNVPSWGRTAVSNTIIIFYGSMVITIFIVIVAIKIA